MYTPIGAAKIVLFLHIRKKKVQVYGKTCTFFFTWKLEGSSIIYKSQISNLQSKIYNRLLPPNPVAPQDFIRTSPPLHGGFPPYLEPNAFRIARCFSLLRRGFF